MDMTGQKYCFKLWCLCVFSEMMVIKCQWSFI